MRARWTKVAAEPVSTGHTSALAVPPLAPDSPTIKKPTPPKPGEINAEPIPPPDPIKKTARAHALSRRMEFRGLKISVETDKGEKRHWYDPNEDKKGSTKMKYPYGYIRMTKGVDGDHVDVYVGPNENAKNVYVVHQQKAPNFDKYDEDKCMLGFDSADAAKKAYLDHYNDERFFGSMTVMPFEQFKKKVLGTFKRPQKIAYDLGVERALDMLFKTAANKLIGDTVKAVRRALTAGNVDKAHEIAQLGIRSKTIEPVMLQRLANPAAGITSHEAQLWNIAGRSAKTPKPVPRPTAAASTAATPTAAPDLVDPQLAQRWSQIKQQQGWS